MSEFAYKIRLPEEMYNKVLAKAQKRTLSVSAYIRDLLVADLGELGVDEGAAPKEEKQRGRPPGTAREKRTAELFLRWGTGDMDGLHTYLMERPPREPTLRRLFMPGGGKLEIQHAAQYYLAEELGVMGAEQFCRLFMDWTKKHMDEYPEWKDEDSADRAHLIRDMLNDLYLLANPE